MQGDLLSWTQVLPADSPRKATGAIADDLPHFRVLAEHFSTFAPLSDAEMQVLRDLAKVAQYHPPYRDLHPAEALLSPPRMIVAGWAAQYCMLPDGQRQIISLRLPGDLAGLPGRVRMPAFCAVAALTELETVSAQALVEAGDAADPVHPGLARAVRAMAHLNDAQLCSQIVRLGRQGAGGRFAHLMLELYGRLGRVGLAADNCFAMPLTQNVLADVLGFSVVHVNRTMQQLRRDGLLEVKAGRVHLLQPERLRTLAGCGTGWA